MEKKVRTTCFDCHSKCGVILTVDDNNDIIRVEGDPNQPVSEGILCVKAFSAQEIHTHPDRLKYPLKRKSWSVDEPHAEMRGKDEWERITWDEALDLIEEKMRKVIDEYGSKSIIISQGTGRGSNHFLDRLNNTWDGGGKVWPTHVCLLPNLAQTHVTWGRMFHPHEACDYRNAGSIVMWGTNPIRSRQYSGLRIMDAKRNGSHVVVVDPVFRDIAAKADLWVPVRPGTDGALALTLTNLMFQSGKWERATELLKTWTNASFLVKEGEERWMLREADLVEGGSNNNFVVWDENSKKPVIWRPETEDFDTPDVDPALMGEYEVTLADGSKAMFKTALQVYRNEVAEWTVEKCSAITWTPEEKIEQMFELITNPTGGRPSLLTAYLGACMMTSNALQSGRAITILQILLNPPIDDKGGIYFNTFWEFMLDPKITAYDKVQPKPRLGYDKYPMYTQVYGQANNPNAAWDAMITGEPWPVKVMISVANDPLGCFEDANKVHKALMSDILELNVDMDYFMTPGNELADIVLPAAHWSERTGVFDEELYPEPCPFIIPQKAVLPPGEALDDWDFQRLLGKRFNPELWPWESSEEMQLWRLREFHHVDVKDYDEAAEIGYFIEFGGDNRITRQHEKGLIKFQTPTKRIEVYSEQMVLYGYDSPLPSFNEPFESPYSTPELYKEYNLCLTTGARDYAFYHSAWTNIAHQRILEPWPYIELNEQWARENQIGEGDWLWVESLRGKMKAKARISKGVLYGAASMCRPNYKHACKELNLPGGSWYEFNPNILTTADGSDPGFGAAPMRSSLCKVTKMADVYDAKVTDESYAV